MSEYRILSGPGAVSFPLLPRVSLNSSSVSSLSGQLCVRVLQICWDHSVHASFPLSCFGCSGLWIAQIKLDLSLRWSLALPCLCLQSLGLFWYDHSLPFVGRIARSVSVVSALSSSQKLFRFRYFCLWCYLLEVLSFGVHCNFELWVWVWWSSSFLPVFHCGTFFCPIFFRSHCATIVAAYCFSVSLSRFVLVFTCAVLTQCLNPTFRTTRGYVAWRFASYMLCCCCFRFFVCFCFCRLNTTGR